MSFNIENFRTLADAILNDGIVVNGKHLGFDMVQPKRILRLQSHRCQQGRNR